MKVQQKVYEYLDNPNKILTVDESFITVNDKLFQIDGNPVKIEDIFVKVNTIEGMLVGYSPLETLELSENGKFVAGKNRIGFVGKDGDSIGISKVRNKIIQWNDKETTGKVDKLFGLLVGKQASAKSENKLINRLIENEYKSVEKDNYTLMYKKGAEPFLFMESDDELTLLDIDEVYSNEDTKKFSILNQDKELVFDIINEKISLK